MYNRGYRCVVCIVRPIHRLLARFWRLFGIQPSLSHTVASLFTLCFTQIAATSLKILHPTIYKELDSNEKHTVFFYDGTQGYFSGLHIFAGTIAIVVLIVLCVTVAYLLLHPLRLFQWCFGKLKFKKDLIIAVTDVFNGPFKDGTSNNTWDYRYFAGMHFAIQLFIMILYYTPLKYIYVIVSMKMLVCGLYIVAILIFRPYKRNIHNFSEVLIFSILTGYAVCPLIPNDDWFVAIIVMLAINGFILLFIVIPYCCYWMIKKCRHCCQYIRDNHITRHNATVVEDNEELLINSLTDRGAVDNIMFADRLMNPEQYRVENYRTFDN